MPDRFVHLKVGLFFLAAGLWLAGVIAGLPWLTGSAILLLAVALVLRIIGARDEARNPLPEEDEPPA